MTLPDESVELPNAVTLVESLRENADYYTRHSNNPIDGVLTRAADTIEKQAAEIARLNALAYAPDGRSWRETAWGESFKRDREASRAEAAESRIEALTKDVAYWRSAADSHFQQAMENGAAANEARAQVTDLEMRLAVQTDAIEVIKLRCEAIGSSHTEQQIIRICNDALSNLPERSKLIADVVEAAGEVLRLWGQPAPLDNAFHRSVNAMKDKFVALTSTDGEK